MKRALFITRKWPPAIGGMETYSREFAQAAEILLKLDKIMLPGEPDGQPPNALAVIWFGITTGFKILISGPKYDFTHGGDLALWPLLWLASLRGGYGRMSIAVHGTDIAYAFRKGCRAGLYRLYLKLGVILLGNIHCIANSRATAALVKNAGFHNVNIVPLTTRPGPEGPMEPVPVDPDCILFVGRLVQRKGCAWFIHNVLHNLPEGMILKVAAPVGEMEEMAALANPRVEYLGPVQGGELAKLRHRALAVITPNIDLGPPSFEGFGMTALEAVMDGGVSLAADLFGLADALQVGETGFLLPAGNAEMWQAKIREIRLWPNKKRQEFISSAQARVMSRNWVNVVCETFQL